MKQTHIVATIGSSSESVEILVKMIKAGLTVARINMSHRDHEEHHRQIVNIRKAEKITGKKLQILVDLAGPKMRLGEMEKDTILKEGKTVVITTDTVLGTAERFSVTYKKLPAEVSKGMLIMLCDGKRKLKVVSTNGKDEIVCKVLVGGLVTSRRGINVPEASLTIPVITAKDKKDLAFAFEHKADMIAVSFVRTAKDVQACRKILQANGSRAQVIAKIETREAMAHLEKIAEVSDGLMVARGDLAMEIGYEHVPLAQRKIIAAANAHGKLSIVATQVLDSMQRSSTPTRAEVSGIAYAVLDGAGALMLSEESAVGQYPVESVEVIHRVAEAAKMVE